MENRICIPHEEYHERIAKAASLVRARGLDAMLVVSTESDYANARYFSGFWPLFERAGVVIAAGAALGFYWRRIKRALTKRKNKDEEEEYDDDEEDWDEDEE